MPLCFYLSQIERKILMIPVKPTLKLIGKAPTHIESEQLLDYFLYVFEFSWSSLVFDEKKDALVEFFTEQAKVWHPNYEEHSIEKRWWLYVLLALNEITEDQKVEYGKLTVQNLIKKLPTLSGDLLEKQVNEIQHAFYDEIPDILTVRPLELRTLENTTLEHDRYLPFFVDNKDHFVNLFKKHLRQKDISKEYFERFIMSSRKRLRQFSTYWDGYYEIFITYFISLYDFRMPQEIEDKEEEYDLLLEMVILFLVASVMDKPKIEDLADEMTEKLKELVDEKW